MGDDVYFLNAEQVAKRMGISQPLAYRLIREWNEKLKKAGKLTIRGRVNRLFFEKEMKG